MNKRDYYDVLGIDKNADASTIKKAYRKLAKEKHPDSGGNEDEFKEIAEAYDVLSNDDKKKQYDTFGHNAPKNSGFSADFSDMFNKFGFGFNPRNEARNRKGKDFRINIKLTLDEIFNGGSKKIKYNRDAACSNCNSTGGFGMQKCKHCNGQGMVIQQIRTPFGIMQNMTTCEVCSGDGNTYVSVCNDCSGSGLKNKEETIEINIPIGVQDGMVSSYIGMGQAIKNGTSGSLVIVFSEIPHKTFMRYGNDLKLNLKLPYHSLVLGDKIKIPTIDDKEILITIPELNKIGDILRVAGKGMKLLNSESRGDLMVVLDIDIPTKLDDETRELLENLKKIENKVVEKEKT
jgi:molecular chaperone DnaJ